MTIYDNVQVSNTEKPVSHKQLLYHMEGMPPEDLTLINDYKYQNISLYI